MGQAVSVERHETIATVILHRPEVRNAIDPPTAAALVAAIQELEADAAVHAMVLWGAGGTFCAGADLRAVSAGWDPGALQPPTGEPADPCGPMGPTRLETTKPVIAAVAGFAVAGGLELAAWCDLRVAEVDAVFGVFCRRWGVPLVDGGTFRLPRLVGESRALDMILTGRAVSAGEALEIGLVNRVVARGEARTAAEALAREIASFPQRCLRADRASCRNQWGATHGAALAQEYARGFAVLASGEAALGATKFVGGAGRSGKAAD
jgi:enoyl-CoA hydratase